MAKQLPVKDVQQFLQNNMTYGDYNFHQIFMIYKEVMNRNGFLEYKPMGAVSLRKRLQEWSDVDGSWLGKKGVRGDTIYFKYEPAKHHCIDFTKAREFLARAKEPKSWFK